MIPGSVLTIIHDLGHGDSILDITHGMVGVLVLAIVWAGSILASDIPGADGAAAGGDQWPIIQLIGAMVAGIVLSASMAEMSPSTGIPM